VTAEIIVANKSGLAIAADSAVTVEQFHNGGMKQKVYNGANKLFMLSKYKPVGIMLYNTTTVGGVPWETIIKSVRQDISDKDFSKLDEYIEYFFRKTDSEAYLFPEDGVRQIVWVNAYKILNSIVESSSDKSDFSKRLDARIVELEKLDLVSGWTLSFGDEVIKVYKSEINVAINISVSPKGYLHGNRAKILRLLKLNFVKKARLSGYSGIVICGFGKEEMFPRVVEHYCDIVLCGKIRRWELGREAVNVSSPSLVMPFADTAVIRTIMEGVNPNYQSSMTRKLAEVLLAIPKELFAPITQLTDVEKDGYAQAAMGAMVSSLSTLLKGISSIRKEEYMEPIKRTIQVLPVSELAVVAETMISVSQIHKRMNPEIESVGGAIDVAVISKGDGFVWIKRKHYFDRDLNPGFIAKYLDK